MNKLANRIHDESNGLDYVLVGDYYLPDIQLGSDEQRSIGRWGRIHLEYLKEYRSAMYNDLLVSGKLWSYLADLNEQANERLEYIIQQMKETEGVTEQLKAESQIQWVREIKKL